jgi:hypothetical protein
MDPYNPYGPDNHTVAAAFFAIFGATVLIGLLIAVAVYVVTALAMSTFFRKVGVKPWIAWVPFYNTWVLLEVGGQRGWFALLSIIPYGSIVTTIFLIIAMYRIGIAFRKPGGFVVLGVFLPFAWAFVLGSRTEVYDPQLITAAGYPPPLAGYGSVVPNYANAEPSAQGYGTPPSTP